MLKLKGSKVASILALLLTMN